MALPNQMQSPGGAACSPTQVTLLAEMARDGDRAAFEQLVDLFHEEIFRMVYYRTRVRMDAEDLTQDIFLLAFRNLSRLRDVDRFKPWLFSIAVNKVRDHLRRKRFLGLFGLADDQEEEPCDEEPDKDPDALHQLMEHEFWCEIKKLSQTFSPMEREVFYLRFMDQLSIKEISQVLKKSESAVKTHLYRALRKFKEDAGFLQMLKGEVS